jgi:hypothetical protein
MKRIVNLILVLLAPLASAAWAQQPMGKETAQSTRPVYYDTFNEMWLNPAKWLATGPWCSGGLECVREIQNGHLRLAVRDFGATDSDSGTQFSESEVDFVNPNAVKSITADVTLRSFSGLGCSTNDTDMTHTNVEIGGIFFNAGTGDPTDDVLAELIFGVDTTDPKTIHVGNWNGQSGWTEVGSYPIGAPLTATFAWDKANHQFIALVKVKGEPGQGKMVAVPYSVSDTTPPASPYKQLSAQAYSLNCTSAKTFAQVEAFYDNVIINQPPPHAE